MRLCGDEFLEIWDFWSSRWQWQISEFGGKVNSEIEIIIIGLIISLITKIPIRLHYLCYAMMQYIFSQYFISVSKSNSLRGILV